MRLLIAFFVVLSWIPLVHAEAFTDRQSAAAAIVGLSTSNAIVEQMSEAVWPTVEKDILSKNPDANPAVMAELKQYLHDLQSNMINDLMGGLIDAYASEFTLDELNGIFDFYQSGYGKKLLEFSPKLAREIMPPLMQKMIKQLPQMTALILKAAGERGLKT